MLISKNNHLLAAGDVGLVEAVVDAVAVSAALAVLFVALVVRLLAGGAPEQAALVRVGATVARVAEGLAHFARHPVHL